VTKDSAFRDETGPLECRSAEEGVLVHVGHVPPYGWKTLAFCEKGAEPAAPVTVTENRAENRYYTVTFNANGEISSLYDRENGREVGCGRPMNVFAAFEDKPVRFDAWDLDIFYREKPYGPFVLTERRVLEASGQRGVLRQVWKFNKSTLTQDFILSADSRRIDFRTTLDWQERQVFLKVYFPVDVYAEEATYEIQFGTVKRPTHTNTEWDFAKFEVSGHRWADLSDGGYGVSVLNDCKYGWDIHGNMIGLSLVKSAVKPDETADRRVHVFTYSLFPHAGGPAESGVQEEAVKLNLPLLSCGVKGTPGAPEFARDSFVQSGCGHVVIDTVKKSEDGRAAVVRVYESAGRADAHAVLRFGRPVVRAEETNLCEEDAVQVPVQENGIRFAVGRFEIRTFRVFF
jgi:alpha-mannosidase